MIYAVVLVLVVTLVATVASALVKGMIKLLFAVIIVFILYSIFWGEGTAYISLLSHVFPGSVQEEMIQGYDYYRQQELLLPLWE